MSLQVNITGADISKAYQDVLNQNGINWALFTYEKGTNDLKLQSTGEGGLEELQDEFSDGRIQYAFVRVKDPNTELPKFVQINWCGDGVPESKKGLFHTHSSAVARFLVGTHVVISARNELDVSPALIMKRVEDSSGSRYTAHKEQPRKFEPIAPVGTSYTPVGKVDINEIRKSAPKPVTAAKPTQAYTPPAPGRAPILPTGPRPPMSSKPVIPSWEESAAPAPPPPPPAATRPIPANEIPSVPSAPTLLKEPEPVSSSITRTKPREEDRIAPVGTNYTPVSLPPPRKLVNPFERMAQASTSDAGPKPPASSSPKKLTWSERQALAKKQQQEEEGRSKAASIKAISPASTGSKWTPPPVRSGGFGSRSIDAEETPTSPPAPPIPFAASRSVPAAAEPEMEAAAPPPPPPPPPPPVAEMAALSVEPAPAAPASSKGVCAVVLYDYEAEEGNEMALKEGETIEQIEQIDEGWWSGVGANGAKSGLFPANYVEIVEQTDEPKAEEEAAAAVPPPPPPPPPPPVEAAAPAAPPAPPAPLAPSAPAKDDGVVAIALYDYDQAEENELSFREGDRITHIEAASEDWWQGRDKHGNVGLFPANYVEVQE